MDNNTSSVFDTTNLIKFLFQWWKHLAIVCSLAAVVSIIISLVIEEKFRATVIMFPASTNSVAKALLVENNVGKHDILAFGEEEQAEQMLQILNSDEIRERICDKYDLMNHYEIDPNDDYVKTQLIEEFEDNVSFKRTEYQSVRIDVLDKDPMISRDIANDIASFVDTVKNRMKRERAETGLAIVVEEYNEVLDYVRAIEDSMTVLRSMGVHEYEVQIERFTEQYAKAMLDGKTAAIKLFEEKLDVLAKHGSAYVSLRNKLEYETERMVTLRAKLKEARVDAHSNLPHKFIVNRAFAAEKKAYPIRWLIVAVSTLSTFLLSIVILITLDSIKRAQIS